MASTVDRILTRRPDAVVVEMGVPVLRPARAARYIRTYGAARVNAQAALEVLHGHDGPATEAAHPSAAGLHLLPTLGLLRVMHAEDLRGVREVGPRLEAVAAAVDGIARRLRAGGRMHYFGGGTSGRLAALDALECPATFGVDPDLVVANIAPGEAEEEDAELGRIAAAELAPRDAAVGVSASGETPYTLASLAQARE